MVQYIKSINLNSIGVLHEPSAYGKNFCEKLTEEGDRESVQVVCATHDPVQDSEGSSIKAGLQSLKDDIPLATAFVGVVYPADLHHVAKHALNLGLAGSGNVWIYSDAIESENFLAFGLGGALYDEEVIKGLQGSLRLAGIGGAKTESGDSGYDRYTKMWEELKDDYEFREYLESHSFQYTADKGTVYFDPGQDLSKYDDEFFPTYPPEGYQPFFYDAVILVGMAACKAESKGLDPKNGLDLRDVLNSIEFDGFSGTNKFDEFGTRDPLTVTYSVQNAYYDDDDKAFFQSSAIFVDGEFKYDCVGCEAVIYSDGSTNPPLQKNEKKATETYKTEIFGSLVVVLAISLICMGLHQQRKNKELARVIVQNYEMEENERTIKKKASTLGRTVNVLSRRATVLNQEVEKLKVSLRKSQHSGEELRLMKKAMEELSQEKSDELRSVLIDSGTVKIENMIGKGGFGEVHLGKYDGQKVAVKRLLDISSDNLERFHFECFLMKNLRHPHIVRLVGVCW